MRVNASKALAAWERGGTEDSPCGIQVPLAWANAIASGVDGYTMTPTEES